MSIAIGSSKVEYVRPRSNAEYGVADIVPTLEKAISSDLIMWFGSSGIVYELLAIWYYGTEDDLARYGHYYRTNGENGEINFVLSVTRKGGTLVHHPPP
ncbi:MAG: hypothetical protein QW478_06905 [Candidatus Micrarchaeaceae archaeon]